MDLSTVHAHLDARSTSAIDASAYTTTAPDGAQHIVFAETPSLATVTHEATHVLQQRAGVVPAGLGAADTTFEHQAEAAATRGIGGPATSAGNASFGSASASGSLGGTPTPTPCASRRPERSRAVQAQDGAVGWTRSDAGDQPCFCAPRGPARGLENAGFGSLC